MFRAQIVYVCELWIAVEWPDAATARRPCATSPAFSFNSLSYPSTDISALAAGSALPRAEDQAEEAGVGHFRQAGKLDNPAMIVRIKISHSALDQEVMQALLNALRGHVPIVEEVAHYADPAFRHLGRHGLGLGAHFALPGRN
ncbi:hypothetical protein AB9F35_00635 [Rhizobium leguminosarum]|uniref:hypothetical protein n=1 Tax=Rhizobium leguminosarum TaxID=384 RepID=UPI00155A5B64|nr:hypothetical protein [Rhizobium leguminosarum]